MEADELTNEIVGKVNALKRESGEGEKVESRGGRGVRKRVREVTGEGTVYRE